MADTPHVAGGHTPSIDALVMAHHAALYRYAFRLVGSATDAEDLTQQTFLAAQTNLCQLRDVQRARSWLFAILRNCFLGMKRQQRELPSENIELHLDQAAGGAKDNPEFDEERLQLALDALPDEFRLVVLMFYYENCSYREIAEKLDLPLGTVMSRLSRAKSHLRRRLCDNVERKTHDTPSDFVSRRT